MNWTEIRGQVTFTCKLHSYHDNQIVRQNVHKQDEIMALEAGTKLGPYEIISPLGAGEVVTTTVA